MARLGQDRGPDIRVRQVNNAGEGEGEVFVVNVQDFIDGAYDPEHFDIVSYADSRMVPVMNPDNPTAVLADESSGAPIMVREFREIDGSERSRIVREAKAERTAAKREAKTMNPDATTGPAEEEE